MRPALFRDIRQAHFARADSLSNIEASKSSTENQKGFLARRVKAVGSFQSLARQPILNGSNACYAKLSRRNFAISNDLSTGSSHDRKTRMIALGLMLFKSLMK